MYTPGGRSARLSVILFCSSLLAVPIAAFAAEDMEEIVVTGSLIRGTPEDAALPVEVYNAQELQDLGNPTSLEFVKNLTVQGPTTGEGYYFTGAQLNNDVGFNLRGIGADKTLTLFNGRRLSGNTTSAVAGGQANTAILPSIAFSRVEILKDGAAVTYGADATGGVVNYITQDAYTGIDVRTSYKTYDGTDGEWSLGLKTGFGEGDTNVIIAGEWDHRSEVDSIDRDFASLPYGVNPAPWSTLTNLAGYIPRLGPLPASPDNTTNGEFGSPLGFPISDYTKSSCEAVGGIYRDTYTCKYGYLPYYNVVEQTDTYRLFAQLNTLVTDNMEFHLQAGWARVSVPHATGSPAQPVIRGPARATGAAYQFFVPVTNPYAAEFAARTGWDQSPLFGLTSGYTPITYRAFAHGGNAVLGEDGNFGVPSTIDNRYFHIAGGVNGTIFNDIGYDFAITYNHQTEYGDAPDVVGYRLQEALNGFGGPNCDVPDLDTARFGTQNAAMAGTGDCMWWNPFASGWAGQPILGLDNPSYVAGSENPAELVRWVFDERGGQNITWNTTMDLVFDGLTPLTLPGGQVAWGAGTQWRTTKLRESVPSELLRGKQPCAWPGQDPADPTDPTYTGCTPDEPGPFVFFSTDLPETLSQDQFSYFVELDFPITDTLYMTAAARHEEFTPGDLKADVYKWSGRWQIIDSFALRGSYGTNYQAPGLGITPGEITNGVNSYTIAAGNWRGAQTITRSGIVPETATVWSVGGIWQSAGFTDGSDIQVLLDYWDIETEDELGLLASANDIADAVFHINPDGSDDPPPTNGSALADCSHPMAARVTFNGDCVQGVTTANDFSNISTEYGNGPGQTTTGIDFKIDYRFPAFGGDLRFGVQATKVREFKFTETVLDGFVLVPPEDRLGYLNFATIAFAAPEWRANFNANFTYGTQNHRLVVNYISGVDDDRYLKADGTVNEAALVPEGVQPGTTDPFGPSYYGVFGDSWVSVDYHFNMEFSFGIVSASIVNILDEDPPEAREELGYDPRMGSPLKRQFEIGFRREFY